MKYLFCSFCTILIALSFIGPKCEHKFVATEQPTIKVERIGWQVGVYIPPPSGCHEGKELICVKCFHVQKQILNYGQADSGPKLTERPPIGTTDTCLFMEGGQFLFDTYGLLRAK